MASAKVKVKLPPALGSYANIFQPRAIGDSKKLKYSIALLWDKEGEATLKELREAIQKVAVEKWGAEAILALQGKPNKAKLKLHNPLKDGDVDKPEDEVYAGKFYVNTSTDRAPSIVDAKLQKVIDDSEAYSGCTFRASVNVYTFDRPEKKGVSLGLNALQVVAKGERLGGGGVDAEEEFKEFTAEPDVLAGIE